MCKSVGKRNLEMLVRSLWLRILSLLSLKATRIMMHLVYATFLTPTVWFRLRSRFGVTTWARILLIRLEMMTLTTQSTQRWPQLTRVDTHSTPESTINKKKTVGVKS